MDDLISRKAVIEAVDRHTREDGTLDDDISIILEEVKTAYDKKTDDNEESNADRIRGMTDEELAEYLTTFQNTFGEEYEGMMSCLDWLKHPVEE